MDKPDFCESYLVQIVESPKYYHLFKSLGKVLGILSRANIALLEDLSTSSEGPFDYDNSAKNTKRKIEILTTLAMDLVTKILHC